MNGFTIGSKLHLSISKCLFHAADKTMTLPAVTSCSASHPLVLLCWPDSTQAGCTMLGLDQHVGALPSQVWEGPSAFSRGTCNKRKQPRSSLAQPLARQGSWGAPCHAEPPRATPQPRPSVLCYAFGGRGSSNGSGGGSLEVRSLVAGSLSHDGQKAFWRAAFLLLLFVHEQYTSWKSYCACFYSDSLCRTLGFAGFWHSW